MVDNGQNLSTILSKVGFERLLVRAQPEDARRTVQGTKV